MRLRIGLLGLTAAMILGGESTAGPLPPGRQHRLSIEGENTVTFIPRVNLAPVKLDYQVKVEYIVDTRYGKESKPATSTPTEDETKPPVEEVAVKKAVVKKGSRAKKKEAESPAPKITGAIDLSLHAIERNSRQNGQSILETRASRSRFQGRVQPDAPVFNVSANDAPPPIQQIIKNFDVVAASLLLNDDLKVDDRRYRIEGAQRAVLETLLSIHTPVPKGVDSWESPTQLVMGHGQTAKGLLKFEKQKPSAIAKSTEAKPSDLIKVKVSGVLKAEGVIAGNLIKDGTYTVTGEQIFDSHTHEWTSARWSVVVVNELANQGGFTVAQARGTMTVESRAVVDGGTSTPSEATPKL